MQTADVLPEKKVEFSKDDFFGKILELYLKYEVEVTTKGNEIIIKGKSLPWKFEHMSDDGEWKTYWHVLDVKVYAIYHPVCCHYGADVTGHNEFFGQSHPVKSRADLDKLRVCYEEHLIKRHSSEYGVQGNLFEDLDLFTGGI